MCCIVGSTTPLEIIQVESSPCCIMYSTDTQYKVINIFFKPTGRKGLCIRAGLDLIMYINVNLWFKHVRWLLILQISQALNIID